VVEGTTGVSKTYCAAGKCQFLAAAKSQFGVDFSERKVGDDGRND
jgi:hypothetical protein